MTGRTNNLATSVQVIAAYSGKQEVYPSLAIITIWDASSPRHRHSSFVLPLRTLLLIFLVQSLALFVR